MIQGSIHNKISRRWYQISGSISQCIQSEIRMSRIEPERFLRSEICRGSTASKGRCPPGALALHPERSQGELVLLDSHLIINNV